MRKLFLSVAVAALAMASSTSAQVGSELPELKAVKWYNTPPLAMDQLHGKAVLFEIFRTW